MLQPANRDTGSAVPPCRARGFTLVELTVTLVVVAILAVAMLPRSPERQINLSVQADQLASDIRYTQSLAMTHGQRFRINFNAASYLIDNLTGVPAVIHPHTGTAAAILLGNGITLATTNAFIVFDGRGTPYNTAVLPGTLLAADAIITLTASGQTQLVRISPQTGRVLVP